MQLKILWEEILDRLLAIEVAGKPKRLFSAFVHGISELPVRIPP
jgi:cytochrome P450